MQRFEISIDKYLYDMIMEYFHRYLDVTLIIFTWYYHVFCHCLPSKTIFCSHLFNYYG